MKQERFYLALSFLGMLLIPSVSFAELNTNNMLDTIFLQYRAAAQPWEPTITAAATWLFWALAAIGLVVAIFKEMTNGELGFNSTVGLVIRWTLVTSVFFTLLKYAPEWGEIIVKSFRQAAGQASGTVGLSPSLIFEEGMSVAGLILGKSKMWAVATNTALILAAFVTVALFAMLALEVLKALVHMYIALYGGIIFMGFGGFEFTREYAMNYYKQVLIIGARLYAIQLVIGIALSVIQSWTSQLSAEPELFEVLGLIGGVIVLLMLVQSIPDMVSGFITGNFAGDGRATSQVASIVTAGAGMAAAAGAASTAAAGSGVGGVSALRQAAGLARDQGAGDGGGLKAAASMVGQAGANLASAVMADAKDQMAGNPGSNAGYTGARVGEALKGKREILRAALNSSADRVAENSVEPK